MGWKWCQILILWVVFWYNFDPRCQKRTQPTTPRTFSFVTLAPKPDFHLHCDQPQHETHNLQHTLSEWICGCFGIPLKNQCLRMLFLYSTQGSDKICQDLQRSAKICQDQTRSTKGSASTNLQAPLAETNHETPSSKNEGAALSRRMASSIRSGPVGARGVFNFKLAFPICFISIILVFFLGYILSGRFFDVKLGGVRRDTADRADPLFRINLFDHTCTFYPRNTYKCDSERPSTVVSFSSLFRSHLYLLPT